jgi:plasmid stabilization system protein ParE
MAALFQLTPQASEDLEAIWSFIARESMDAANRVEDAILDACNLLAQNPLLGSRRASFSERPLRFWAVTQYPNYIVVYRPESVPLRVVAVIHGKRQIAAVLKKHDRL